MVDPDVSRLAGEIDILVKAFIAYFMISFPALIGVYVFMYKAVRDARKERKDYEKEFGLKQNGIHKTDVEKTDSLFVLVSDNLIEMASNIEKIKQAEEKSEREIYHVRERIQSILTACSLRHPRDGIILVGDDGKPESEGEL